MMTTIPKSNPSDGGAPRFAETADVETASEEYARRFAGPVGKFFLEIQTRLFLELLARWPDATVLDVGGGHAQLAVPLVQGGFRLTVTGSSESCRERLDRNLQPGSFTFRVCDVLDLPYEDNEFDVVVAFRLLPHVDQWQKLIREMCRVARLAVIIDYPDRRSFNLVQKAFFGWKKAVERNTRPFRCFARAEVAAEFAKNRFGKPEYRPEYFVPMAIHRALGRQRVSSRLEAISRGLGLTRLFGSPVILRAEYLP